MTVENQDFTMWQGDDKTLTITVTDEDGGIVNLTTCTVIWVLSESAASDVTKVYKSTGNGGVVLTTPLSGICTVTLTETDTINLEAGEYYHEAHMVDTVGNTSTILTGYVTLKATSSH